MRERTSGLGRDLLVGFAIARTEGLDLWRRNDSRRQRAIYALLILLLLPAVLLFIRAGYSMGVETREGVELSVVAVARNLLLPAMLALSVLGGLGAAQSLARDPVKPLVLTSAPTRAIVVGKVLYLLGTWLTPMSLFLIPAVSYAVGARSPLFVVSVALFGLPLLLVTLLVGLTFAYLLWVGIERLGLPEYVRRIFTALISLLVFVLAFTGGFLSGQVSATADQLPTGDPLTPVGWYADLLFLGSPLSEPLGWRTPVAAGLVFLAIPAVFALLVRTAPAFWYASPTRGDDEETGDGDSETTGATSERRPSELIGRTGGLTARSGTLRAARGYVRSALRRPDQYVYLLYYVFPVLGILLPIAIESPGTFPPALGGSLVLLGVWLAGALFCLNPLGTEGAMLSQLVLAEKRARTFVHARLLVGVCLGLAVTLTGALLFAATGPSVPTAFLLLGTTLVLGVVLASASFALGIGSALPKFETTEVFDSVETLAPSIVAALVHGAVTLVLATAAVALALLSTFPDSPLSSGQRVALVALFVALLVVVADGSRRYAVARLGDYGRERAHVDRLFSVYAGIVLSLLAVVLGQAVGLTVAFLVGLDRPIEVLLPLLFVAEYVGYLLVALGFLYVTRRGLAYLDVERPSGRDLGYVAGGVLASAGVWALAVALISGLGLPVGEHPLFSADEGDPWLLLALVPLVLLVNAPVEELLYRNVIQKYLQEQFRASIAVVLSSAIFALAHVIAYFDSDLLAVVVTLSLLFAISCLWGAIYVRTRSLVIVSVIHGIYNASLLGLSYVTTVT